MSDISARIQEIINEYNKILDKLSTIRGYENLRDPLKKITIKDITEIKNIIEKKATIKEDSVKEQIFNEDSVKEPIFKEDSVKGANDAIDNRYEEWIKNAENLKQFDVGGEYYNSYNENKEKHPDFTETKIKEIIAKKAINDYFDYVTQKDNIDKIFKGAKNDKEENKNVPTGYEVKKVKGDGNCMYYSVLRASADKGIKPGGDIDNIEDDGVLKSEMQKLRKELIDFIQNDKYKNCTLYTNLTDSGDEEFVNQIKNEMLHSLREYGNWGGFSIMMLIECLYDIKIRVFEKKVQSWIVRGKEEDGEKVINLYYSSSSHYDWLKKTDVKTDTDDSKDVIIESDEKKIKEIKNKYNTFSDDELIKELYNPDPDTGKSVDSMEKSDYYKNISRLSGEGNGGIKNEITEIKKMLQMINSGITNKQDYINNLKDNHYKYYLIYKSDYEKNYYNAMCIIEAIKNKNDNVDAFKNFLKDNIKDLRDFISQNKDSIEEAKNLIASSK